jgi:iron-sulfur cluster repair protein YtfE (RIC family)
MWTNGVSHRAWWPYPAPRPDATIELAKARGRSARDRRCAVTMTSSADQIEGQLLDHEHRRVRAGLAHLRDAVADVHHLTRSEATDHLAQALGWLRRDLLPHATWEEAWLYPHLDATAGTPWATRALRFEHEQIREVARALETEFQAVRDHWSVELAFRVAVALTRLESLVSAHLAQEERFLPPLLDGVRGSFTRR